MDPNPRLLWTIGAVRVAVYLTISDYRHWLFPIDTALRGAVLYLFHPSLHWIINATGTVMTLPQFSDASGC